jgi:fucose permease
LSVAPSRAALLTSVYWLSYVSGRVVATALVYRVGPGRVLEGALAALTAGAVVLALAVGHAPATTVAIVLVGAATGPIYPAMFGVVTLRFANRAAFAVSVVAAMGSVGAMLLPWAMGLTLPLSGGRVLAASPLLLGVGMWVCYRVSGVGRQSGVTVG